MSNADLKQTKCGALPTTISTPTNAGPERAVARCKNCQHWEPSITARATGYCPVFDKDTDANHGEHCTALLPITVHSASAVDAPPTDAPEPPWVGAARKIERLLTRGYSTNQLHDALQKCAEAHAAALAQERDVKESDCLALTNYLGRCTSERETLRATVASLTAERDRYLTALERIVAIGEDTSPGATLDWEHIARVALSSAPGSPKEAP